MFVESPSPLYPLLAPLLVWMTRLNVPDPLGPVLPTRKLPSARKYTLALDCAETGMAAWALPPDRFIDSCVWVADPKWPSPQAVTRYRVPACASPAGMAHALVSALNPLPVTVCGVLSAWDEDSGAAYPAGVCSIIRPWVEPIRDDCWVYGPPGEVAVETMRLPSRTLVANQVPPVRV